MTKTLIELEKDALRLSENERAILVAHLIETLDKGHDEKVEELWLVEAERRYEEYKKGNLTVIPAEEVFKEVRSRLK